MLAGNFNFGGLNPIFDPDDHVRSARTPAASWQTDAGRSRFPNNQVPAEPLRSGRQEFPQPQSLHAGEQSTSARFNAAFGPTNNLISPTNYRSYRTRFDIKLDQQFSANHKMFGRYSQVRHRSWRDRLSPEIAWTRIRLARRADSDRPAQRRHLRHLHDQPDDDQRSAPRLQSPQAARSARPPSVRIGRSSSASRTSARKTFPTSRLCNNQSNCTGGTTFFRQDALSRSSGSRRGLHLPGKPDQDPHQAHLKFGYETIRTRFNSLVAALPSGTYRFGATDFPFRPNTGNAFRGVPAWARLAAPSSRRPSPRGCRNGGRMPSMCRTISSSGATSR